MTKPKLTLYFDLHSPYSYLAFWYIKKNPAFKSCDVSYVPVLLVAFVNAIGLKPPWSSPNKVNYMFTDLARWCRELGIPWKDGLPANYPFKATTLQIQRALAACSLLCPGRYEDLIAELYHAFWVEKRGVQLPEVYRPILVKVLGEDAAAKVLEKGTSEEVKVLLKRNTEGVLAEGSPGLPWIKAENSNGEVEHYWGFDHLGQVARFLGIERSNGPHL